MKVALTGDTALAESGKLTHEMGQASGETHHG